MIPTLQDIVKVLINGNWDRNTKNNFEASEECYDALDKETKINKNGLELFGIHVQGHKNKSNALIQFVLNRLDGPANDYRKVYLEWDRASSQWRWGYLAF
jgi:hypothetical protein